MKFGSLLVYFFLRSQRFPKQRCQWVVFLNKIPPTIFLVKLLLYRRIAHFFRTIFIPKKLRWKWEGRISSTCKNVFQNGLLQKPQHLLFKSCSFSTISPQTKIRSIFKPLFVGFSMTNESWLVIPPIIGSLKKDPSM